MDYISLIKSMYVHKNHIDEICFDSFVGYLKSQNITMYHLIVLYGQNYNVPLNKYLDFLKLFIIIWEFDRCSKPFRK